jgi:hypothetical protein
MKYHTSSSSSHSSRAKAMSLGVRNLEAPAESGLAAPNMRETGSKSRSLINLTLPKMNFLSNVLHGDSHADYSSECPVSPNQALASSAAMHPDPAEVIACRYRLSCTSPHAKIPGMLVLVVPGPVRM